MTIDGVLFAIVVAVELLAIPLGLYLLTVSRLG